MDYVYIREEGANGARLDKISAPSDTIGWDIARERGQGGKLYVGVPFQESGDPLTGAEVRYIALGRNEAGGSRYEAIAVCTLAEAWRAAREKFGPSAWLGVAVPEPPPRIIRKVRKRDRRF